MCHKQYMFRYLNDILNLFIYFNFTHNPLICTPLFNYFNAIIKTIFKYDKIKEILILAS